jgi:hypothetical protein
MKKVTRSVGRGRKFDLDQFVKDVFAKIRAERAKPSKNKRAVKSNILLAIFSVVLELDDATGVEDERFAKDEFPWVMAVVATELLGDPQSLIDLLAQHVPPEGMKYVADMLNRKLGNRLGRHKKGHHSRPLWYTPETEVAARLVGIQDGTPVNERLMRASDATGIDTEIIAGFYSVKSGHSSRIKKARRRKTPASP